MMSRWGYLLCMALAFWPLRASAQPLFRYERNWTVTMGEHLYGLRQVVQIPGERRFTQVGLAAAQLTCAAGQTNSLQFFSSHRRILSRRLGFWSIGRVSAVCLRSMADGCSARLVDSGEAVGGDWRGRYWFLWLC